MRTFTPDYAAPAALSGEPAPVKHKNDLASSTGATQVPLNTRAVPLVRKNDAHQGRVSFLPKFESSPGVPTP